MDGRKPLDLRARTRWIGLIVCVAALALVGFLNYGTWRHRTERLAIDAEQAGLQRRIDAFREEQTAAHAPYTPAQVQERKERLDAIQQDLDALKRRSDRSR